MRMPSAPTTAGAALLLGALAHSAGCGEPSARVLAAWISADEGVEVQQVELYDDGRRYAVPWAPAVPGSGTQLLQVGVDNRGRGVALSGPRGTIYQSVRDGRRASLDDGDYAGAFSFARNADALLRFYEGDGQTRELALAPSASRLGAAHSTVAAPIASELDSVWVTITASDAPVMFWVEQAESPQHSVGVVQALAYPSEVGEALPVSEPTVLAYGRLEGRAIVDGGYPARVTGNEWCTGRTCASPSGRVLSTMMPDEPCVLALWTWAETPSPLVPVESERTPLPGGCPVENDPFLVAQIADDVFVLDDDDRVYVADLSADTMQAVPKLGDGLATMMVRDRGRVVLLVTLGGQIVHVDASGPRLLATEQTFCSLRDGLLASPSGNWVVQTCGQGSLIDVYSPIPHVGTVVRVSSLGLERFFGIPMRPLGIDDEGNVLLYSYRSGDAQGAPRGLFVLTGDDHLARVDPLVPTPAPIAISPTTFGRFSSSAIE